MTRKTQKKPTPKIKEKWPKFELLFIVVTIISILAFIGPGNMSTQALSLDFNTDKNKVTKQLEKEFAYSFCALKVIENVEAAHQQNAKYFYQCAEQIFPQIQNKAKLKGLKDRMHKSYWEFVE